MTVLYTMYLNNFISVYMVYSQNCVTYQLLKYYMEVHEIFRVFAKWLDNNGYKILWLIAFRIDRLDTEELPFILDHPPPSDRL